MVTDINQSERTLALENRMDSGPRAQLYWCMCVGYQTGGWVIFYLQNLSSFPFDRFSKGKGKDLSKATQKFSGKNENTAQVLGSYKNSSISLVYLMVVIEHHRNRSKHKLITSQHDPAR